MPTPEPALALRGMVACRAAFLGPSARSRRVHDCMRARLPEMRRKVLSVCSDGALGFNYRVSLRFCFAASAMASRRANAGPMQRAQDRLL